MSAIAHRLPREMAILGVLEGILSFAAICMVFLAANTKLPVLMPTAAFIMAEIVLAFCLSVLLSVFALTAGLYRPQPTRSQVRLLSAGPAALVGFGSLLFFLCAELTGPAGGEVVLAARLLGGWGLAVITARALYGLTLRRRSFTRRILLVGDSADTCALHHRLAGATGFHFDLLMPQQPECSWNILRKRRIWAIVIAPSADNLASAELLDCKMRGLRVLTAAAFQEMCLGRVDLNALTAADLLFAYSSVPGTISSAVKRLCDLLFGFALLFASVPVMLLTAVVIKLDSPGPVLYTQQRIGRLGKPFTVLKFRSMTLDAEAEGTPRWAQKQDPRVTRVGRFIRNTRIDELPQLLNVISGEMSLVGPRPERPHFVEELIRAIPFYQQRNYVKPGLTGWAQVNYPYGASVEDAREKLAYDLYYIKNRSLMLDLAILCDTIRVVLNGDGAR